MTKIATIATSVALAGAFTRTQDEIVERINAVRPADPFSFEWPEYIGALDYEHAKPFLTPETTSEQWDNVRPFKNVDDVVAQMKSYLPYAWQEANGKRAMAAMRSIMHFVAWIWLTGDDTGVDFILDSLNADPCFGKDTLNLICQHFGFDSLDDGDRTGGDSPLQDPGLDDDAVTVPNVNVEANVGPITQNDALVGLLGGIGLNVNDLDTNALGPTEDVAEDMLDDGGDVGGIDLVGLDDEGDDDEDIDGETI